MNEIVEMIFQWHQGAGFKQIERSLGFDRNTVRKYIRLAQMAGVARGTPFPPEEELAQKLQAAGEASFLRTTPARALIAPHRDWIAELLHKGKKIDAKQIWRLFEEKTEQRIGYCTMLRYLRSEFHWCAPVVTVRIEVEPGSQAQVDFGSAGMMREAPGGRLRKAWAFIMVLSYSRHRYVRFVFHMDVRTWIDCHERAFAFFNGCPATVVLDNLRSGVIKPDIYDPTLNRAYAEMERHYGFVADPAKLREAKHKGKVERLVPVVRGQLLAGRDLRDIEEANEKALLWCKEQIGMQIHGTTKRRPFEVFQNEEASCLKALPAEAFDIPLWKACTVHPDHHIVFDRSYYSLSTRFIGKQVWVRGGRRQVRVFLDGQLIKTHNRSFVPGTFVTDQSDYPPDKLAYLMAAPTYCRRQAAQIGPQTEALVRNILGDHAMRNLRKAQAVLRLAQKYGSAAMESAAERSLFFGNFRYRSIKAILENGWKPPQEPVGQVRLELSELGKSFLRPADYFTSKTEVLP